jgi:hypothetical protein
LLSCKISALLKRLEARATAGSEIAKEHLNWLRWKASRELQEEIKQKAMAGQKGWPRPIRTLLEMADFTIPLLLWLAEHQRENVKQYARDRWAWPGYFHLLKREQRRYQALLPKFNKTGKEIVEASSIELGTNLGLKLNANLTKGDYLFLVAADSVRNVVQWDVTEHWLWLMSHHHVPAITKGKKYFSASKKFLSSLGEFTKENWPKWKPVFDTYLTVNYAPPEIKFAALPADFQTTLYIAYLTGTERRWFENFRKSNRLTAIEETQWLADLQANAKFFHVSPPLLSVDRPEIREIVSDQKTERGKWNKLKDEVLKRIEKLAPVVPNRLLRLDVS